MFRIELTEESNYNWATLYHKGVEVCCACGDSDYDAVKRLLKAWRGR